MKISVAVRPGSGEEKVEELGEGKYKVWVKDPPVKGLANKAVVYVLAKHLGVSQSQVRIVSGYTSRNKIIEVL
ncbi:MAG TPA: DUF167 domain-containing protein [Candidatus Paceibacterota bacterium]